jgi:predicted glycogen debranching enzyme
MDRLTFLQFARADFTAAEQSLGREWLVTNGLGGFAAGTVAQANTRRYHGLLIASLRPPVERVMMVSKVDASASYAGRRFELACNEFADNTLSPRGFELLGSFHLDGLLPVWNYALADAQLEQSIWMEHECNTTHLRYTLLSASAPLELTLNPLCGYRDYHSQSRGGWHPEVAAAPRSCRVTAYEGARSYSLTLDAGEFEPAPDWYWGFHHRAEAERGLDATEDLFRPGLFRVQLNPGESVTLTMTAEAAAPGSLAKALTNERMRQRKLLEYVPAAAPAWVRQLTLAADQFIVRRVDAAGQARGTTVIAGYPWFSDWGRDTMIALPGLALATHRYADAAAILRTFAQHVSDGMLPNRFPDSGEAAEYNTVDATLWYFHAIAAYLDSQDDPKLLRELYPVLKDILSWHRRGTRYGIQVDPDDGLLRAGEPGVQLTWMDARIGDWVVTPRIGKPVEINALWHHALHRMAGWAMVVKDHGAAKAFAAAANQAMNSFRARFWLADANYLADVVDGERIDRSLRPNQLFAVSLAAGLLSAEQERAVVEICGRELLTPVGLRSLAPHEPDYVGCYQGGPRERDACYHQGTVWGWLLGPYALAHFRVYGNAARALAVLGTIAAHLGEACLGNISEIFDGDAPHAPRGCFAQAWSVSETLRAWQSLNRSLKSQPNRGHS